MKKLSGKTKIKKKAKILSDKRDIRVLPVNYTVTVSVYFWEKKSGDPN
jgi:hypothetical protein